MKILCLFFSFFYQFSTSVYAESNIRLKTNIDYSALTKVMYNWAAINPDLKITETNNSITIDVFGPKMKGDHFIFKFTKNELGTFVDFLPESQITRENDPSNTRYPIQDAVDNCNDGESKGLKCFDFKINFTSTMAEQYFEIKFFPYSNEDDDWGTSLIYAHLNGQHTESFSYQTTRSFDDDRSEVFYNIKGSKSYIH